MSRSTTTQFFAFCLNSLVIATRAKGIGDKLSLRCDTSPCARLPQQRYKWSSIGTLVFVCFCWFSSRGGHSYETLAWKKTASATAGLCRRRLYLREESLADHRQLLGVRNFQTPARTTESEMSDKHPSKSGGRPALHTYASRVLSQMILPSRAVMMTPPELRTRIVVHGNVSTTKQRIVVEVAERKRTIASR